LDVENWELEVGSPTTRRWEFSKSKKPSCLVLGPFVLESYTTHKPKKNDTSINHPPAATHKHKRTTRPKEKREKKKKKELTYTKNPVNVLCVSLLSLPVHLAYAFRPLSSVQKKKTEVEVRVRIVVIPSLYPLGCLSVVSRCLSLSLVVSRCLSVVLLPPSSFCLLPFSTVGVR
jgi:hypothetical protein